ncbi:type III secretion system export apparatus subunit SctU [Vibrio aquimaris]|uniref:Yop proteins translocation protein U n=1 Tax=Vibrio aquimaris TaxID=2587862 RepID=A0A5P9CP44_9VIBR|nr:type III secretion system export apparatus subunit SctU [Vibrio aquimaris]QFT27741.1 Yop proteins translocation protein U [Vibrio aquimaris]
MEEKTEKPTPKKIKDARKKGQVAKSKEIPSLALMLTTLIWLLLDSGRISVKLEELFSVTGFLEIASFSKAAEGAINHSLGIVMEVLLPFLLLVVVVGIFSNIGQFGPLFAPESMKLDIKKIDPISGAKKIFCKKNFIEFLLSLIKVIIFSITVAFVIYTEIPNILQLPYASANSILPVAAQLFISLFVIVTAPLFVIAILDLLFQRHNHEKELKMSKDEVKREYKQSEGNPEIKQKRKEFHNEIQSGGMKKQLKKTSVVIANPTHITVGLFYDKADAPIPVVSLKYTGKQALRLKKLAQKNNIPIVENVPLARGLYADADLYESIPRVHFEAVSDVIKWVNSLNHQDN